MRQICSIGYDDELIVNRVENGVKITRFSVQKDETALQTENKLIQTDENASKKRKT
jgi:hypothetical protein